MDTSISHLPFPQATWPQDKAQPAIPATHSCAGARWDPQFGVKSQKLGDKMKPEETCAGRALPVQPSEEM